VWTQLRCAEHEFLEPPPDVDTTLPEDPDATTRERLEQHLVDDSCATCHRIIDPLGFAFEHYDAIGRWRDEDNGQPIDASGSLPALGDFDGAAELAALLSRDGEVKRCFADRMFTFAVGRAPDEDGEACTIDALRESFLDSDGGDVRALMLTIVRSDAFRYRPVAQ
jgi:hypothetical protein